MKYTCSIEIKGNPEQIAQLWANEDHFASWQDGFQSIERIKGDGITKGSRSRIILNQGGRPMELIETIIESDLPKVKTALYDHIHMSNTQTTRFESLPNGNTRYISEVEYLQFHSWIPKLMAWLIPGVFKKQSMKWMKQFKKFAESHSSK